MADEDEFETENEGEFLVIEPEIPKALTKDEAADCLNCVGPTFRKIDKVFSYSSCSYAYVAMDVVGRNLTSVDVLPYFAHVMFLDLSKNRLTSESLNALAEMEQLVTLVVDNNRLETAFLPTFPQLQNHSNTPLGPTQQNVSRPRNSFRSHRRENLFIPQETGFEGHNWPLYWTLSSEEPSVQTWIGKGQNMQILLNRGRNCRPYFINWEALDLRILILSLRSNQITSCKVNSQPNLEYFELAENNIQEMKPMLWGPKRLPKLKELGLRSNRLTSSAGINFPNLVSLFLANNEITVLNGLEVLTNLKFLHLRNNPLEKLDGFSEANRKLFYLNIRECKIEDAKELKKLSVLPKLERIVVLDNPFTQTNYRVQVIAFLPKLRRIDKLLVEKNEKRKAKRLAKRMSERENEEDDEEEEELEV